MATLNQTHDPARRSWVETANDPKCAFPIQNLPYGVFSLAEAAPRVGVAIGDTILDLSVLEADGLVRPGNTATVFDKAQLNDFMALGHEVWSQTRAALSDLLEASNGRLRDDAGLRARALVPMSSVRLHLPLRVAGFTDFFASRYHATNVGTMLRGADNALSPNWLHMPMAYTGRASTVVVSGTPIRRPLGQMKPAKLDAPVFGASRRLDIELELGAIVGVPSRLGEPVTLAEADRMIFGYVLLNDWSARDIQGWESNPLGPFQGKAFASTISPWIVTQEALEPYRVAAPEREVALLPYLQEHRPGNFDIDLEVGLRAQTAAAPTIISRTNARHLYYSPAQQLVHHAVCGCAMSTGDLLGSGTVSGPEKGSYGSMLELSWAGKEPIALEGGETRSFLQDGDSVSLSGACEGRGHRIGFGTCEGTILPAVAEPTW